MFEQRRQAQFKKQSLRAQIACKMKEKKYFFVTFLLDYKKKSSYLQLSANKLNSCFTYKKQQKTN